MKFLLTLWISKVIARVVNLVDKNRGTNYCGKIAVKMMPDFIAHFKNIDPDKVIFITGTNGKSTTTNLVTHTLRSAGRTVASNVEGANMMTGVATTLIKNSTLGGKLNKEFLVLEIDERSFPGIHNYLKGGHMGFTNLQKDQVQRNGDPDFILRKFQNSISKDMTLYLNNEEPRSRSLEDFAGDAVYFSVGENPLTYTRSDFYDVTMPCPKCGHPIVFERFNLVHIGPFHCTHCGYASKQEPQVRIDEVDFEGKNFTCHGTQWNIHYNNPFYIYNYAMCIAICRHYALTDEQLKQAFDTFVNPASHNNVIRYHGKEIHYIRAKQENPEALQSQLDIVAADPRQKTVMVGLYKVMDFDPHYAGTFYFFDCDFTPIVESGVEHFVAFSADVCYDIANRMILGGADPDKLTIVDSDDPAEIFKPLDHVDAEVVYLITNMKSVKRNIQHLTQEGADHE